MCLLAVAMERKMSDDEIVSANDSNPHGIGIGWIEPVTRKVCYQKGMDIEQFKEFYKDFDVLPHVVHFRYSSIGGTSPTLTHPFIVSDKSPLQMSYRGNKPVLFHNGHYSEWKGDMLDTCRGSGTPIPAGQMTDTRALAVIVSVMSKNYLDYINGRYAFISHDGISRYGDFILDNGIYFSNTSYRTYVAKTFTTSKGEPKKKDEPKKNGKYAENNKMSKEEKDDLFLAWSKRYDS